MMLAKNGQFETPLLPPPCQTMIINRPTSSLTNWEPPPHPPPFVVKYILLHTNIFNKRQFLRESKEIQYDLIPSFNLKKNPLKQS